MNPRVASLLLPIIYLGYISLGLPDGTLGIAWPAMQKELALPFDLAGQVMLVVTGLAMGSSISSAWIVKRFQTGPVVFLSCCLTGIGLLLISQCHSALGFFLASLPLGLGAGAVDSCLNGFVAKHYSRRHMHWLHACWGIGATLGPLIMTKAFALTFGWRGGFASIACVQLLLAAIFLMTLRLWKQVPDLASKNEELSSTKAATTPKKQHSLASEAAWISPLLFAIYVAVEGSVGLWANSVLVLSRKFPLETAGFCVTAYYGSITAGRIIVGFLPATWTNRTIIRGGLLLSVCAAFIFLRADTVVVALPALILLGLGFAPVFPGLMHEVPKRFLAEHVQTMIGRQGACAYIGAALAPPCVGWLAVHAGIEVIPILVSGGALLLLLGSLRLDRIS